MARSAMHSRYGGLLRLVFERLFGPIHYPKSAASRIRELAQEGTVVYVTRARSTLLGLYFNYTLSRLRLPMPSFVGGLNLLLWQPVERLWKLLRQRRSAPPPEADWPDRRATAAEAILIDIAKMGEPAFLFLSPGRTPGGRKKASQRSDYVRALIAAQRSSPRPIFLVPHVLIERGQTASAHRGITERLFGDRRNPGRLRHLVMFLSGLRMSTVRVGPSVDLRELLAANPDADDITIARKARHLLDRRIREEQRVVAGPETLDVDTLRRHVLRNARVQREIEREVERGTGSHRTLERKAAGYFKEIAARFDVRVVKILAAILAWVFNRIYDGIVVDRPGLERATEAGRRGPIIYCPCHRSHIDYLVLSSVLWHHGVAPPHIAAGANMAFFPMGYLFRRGGAFFLRRTFRDNPLYAAVFRGYVEELLSQGTALEFFPEGTRSRTGKLLMPRFGMFSMIIEAWRRGATDDVQFVPVSIDYERIIEASAYERELRGGEKKPEDIGQLLRTTRVLRSRYGRVHLQFGEPISLEAIARQQGLPPGDAPEHEPAWRREIERMGYRVLHEVGKVASVTPSSVVATALLAYGGRGLAQARLVRHGLAIIDFLETGTARLSDSLVDEDGRRAAILEAVGRMVDDGLVAVDHVGHGDAEPIYRAPEEMRIRLDYHKNAVMNHFAPAATVCRAITRHGEDGLDTGGIENSVNFLSRLFKREFIYPVDTTFTSQFEDTLATLAARGIIDVHEDGAITVREPQTVQVLSDLLDPFVEAYWITTGTLRELRSFPLWDKELQTRALEHARRAFLEGTIRRPEAANRTLVSAAVEWLRLANVIEVQHEGKRRTVALTPEFSGEMLEALIDDIGIYR